MHTGICNLYDYDIKTYCQKILGTAIIKGVRRNLIMIDKKFPLPRNLIRVMYRNKDGLRTTCFIDKDTIKI